MKKVMLLLGMLSVGTLCDDEVGVLSGITNALKDAL